MFVVLETTNLEPGLDEFMKLVDGRLLAKNQEIVDFLGDEQDDHSVNVVLDEKLGQPVDLEDVVRVEQEVD